MIELVLIMGGLMALAFVILMHKIGIKKFTGYSVHTDILVSGVLTILFLGTFAGMLTAAIGGIFVSLYLAFAKYVFGSQKYSVRKGWN
jgi:hypothetical protein